MGEDMTIDEVDVVGEEDTITIAEVEKWIAVARVDIPTIEANRKKMVLVNSIMVEKMRTLRIPNRTGMIMLAKKKMMVNLQWTIPTPEMQLIPNKLNQKLIAKVKIIKLKMNHQEKKLRKN